MQLNIILRTLTFTTIYTCECSEIRQHNIMMKVQFFSHILVLMQQYAY